jgi:two-component system NtrC family sensor kinase
MSGSEKNGAAPSARILVVDDDKNAASYINEFIRRAGYDTNVCHSGSEALGFIKNRKVDLVLLDVVMPGMDGFATAAALKKYFGKANFVPIIFLTALSGQQEKITGLRHADDFVTKPFHPDELLARIKVMLRIRELQAELLASKSKYEQEQKNARTQLYRSARLASIGTFASGVAHELNNPLTAILGFSAALLERAQNREPVDWAELEQYLSIINSETLRCRDTVENLSRFAREGEAQIQEFGLNECLSGALKLVNARAVKKMVGISSTIAPDVRIKADMQKLQQAIVYVLTNSLDFCTDGCAVEISYGSSGGFVTLSISDNGPGIPPEVLPKVFDPFFTTKEVGQGVGLGLAMSHVIMEECNGGIDVASDMGSGTTVVLQIPAA